MVSSSGQKVRNLAQCRRLVLSFLEIKKFIPLRIGDSGVRMGSFPCISGGKAIIMGGMRG